VQQRDEKAPRAGSEVEDASGALGTVPQRRLDHRLAFGSGDEGLGGHREGQSPELPLADDPGHRLARKAPLDRRPEPPRSVLAECRVRVGGKRDRLDPEAVGEQHPGIERGVLDTRRVEGTPDGSERLLPCARGTELKS
jgi:hypothetical protein